jgi:hypothetical protein
MFNPLVLAIVWEEKGKRYSETKRVFTQQERDAEESRFKVLHPNYTFIMEFKQSEYYIGRELEDKENPVVE